MFTLELYGIYKRSSVLLNCIILRNKRYTLLVWCYSNPDK